MKSLIKVFNSIIFSVLALLYGYLFYFSSVRISGTIKYSNSFKFIFGILAFLIFFHTIRYFLTSKNKFNEIKNILFSILLLVVPILIKFINFNSIFQININLSANYVIFLKVGYAASLVYTFYSKPFKTKIFRFSKIPDWYIVWGTTAFFALLYFSLSSLLQYKFHTTIFDLGIYDNKAWTFGHFLPQFNSILGMNNFADHFEPILFVVGLLYRIWDNIHVLLLFEAAAVALGFVPIYFLGKEILKDRLPAFFIGISYLIFMGVIQAINYPVHPGTWLPTFYAFALWFAYSKKFIFYYLFLILALSCKESAFIHIFFIGLSLILVFKQKLHGLLTLLLALFSYYFILKIVMFSANGHQPYVHGIFSGISNDPVQFIKFVLLHPIDTLRIAFNHDVKAQTLYLTLGSSGFLVLLAPIFLILVLPFFVERLLTDHPAMPTMNFHYSAPIAFAIFTVTILAIANLQKRFGKGIARPLAIFCFLSSFLIMFTTLDYRTPLLIFAHKSNFVLSQNDLEAYEIINQVPKNASIVTQDVFGPHLSHRQKIGLFDGNTTTNFDYILLSKNDSYGSWPVNYDTILKSVNELKENNSYKVFAENNTLVLFKKK